MLKGIGTEPYRESQNVHLAVKDKLKKEGRSFELIPEDLDVIKKHWIYG